MTAESSAWGWVEALRAGATVGWVEWRATDRADTTAGGSGRLPGAQQLALLLQLNRRAAAAGTVLTPLLVERVLAAEPAGRGRVDLRLVGLDAPDHGPRPVDPGVLPAGDLLRVAATLLAEDVADLELPVRTTLDRARSASHRWRWLVQPFVVVGSSWRAQAVRADLAAHGHPTGGRRPTAYLLAPDLATLLADAWTARCFDQGGLTWGAFLGAAAGSGGLPPRADLPRMARSAAQRYGADRLVVVTDPTPLAERLGVPRLAEPPRLGAHAVDLVRRIGEPLGLRVDHDRRPALLHAALADRLDGRGGATVTVPLRWSSWLDAQAERAHHDLAAAGYPVLGDLDALLPPPQPAQPVHPDDDAVLDLALDLLLEPVGTR